MASNTKPDVSQPFATASFITGAWLGTIEANTVIKIMGNNNEKTIEVGLRKVASKLYFAIVKAAFTWLAGLYIPRKYRNNVICFSLKF
jgi:hypothetical protein